MQVRDAGGGILFVTCGDSPGESFSAPRAALAAQGVDVVGEFSCARKELGDATRIGALVEAPRRGTERVPEREKPGDRNGLRGLDRRSIDTRRHDTAVRSHRRCARRLRPSVKRGVESRRGPWGTGPPRAVIAMPPPPDRRPDPPANDDTTFLDLIAAGMIGVTARGAFRRRVQPSIENREGSDLSFVIPIETLFDSGGTKFQSMITTYDHPVHLAPDKARTERVRAACENLGPREPRPYDTFQRIWIPDDPRLAAVLRSLDRHGATSYARQAAVWIMTSGACLAGFGTRVSGEARLQYVNEDEAALAMLAIDQNGVDITSKAIWDDMSMIKAGVSDPSVRAWFDARC